MKKTLVGTMFTIVSTVLIVGCGQTTQIPADTVIAPDTATLQKQQDFDQDMIEQSRNEQSKK